MKIIGLDISSSAVGWCVLHANSNEVYPSGLYVDYGEWTHQKKSAKLWERLDLITERAQAMANEYYRLGTCDTVAYEGGFHLPANSARTTYVLGMARGLVLLPFHRLGYTMTEYQPADWRKRIGFKGGRATKEQVISYIKRYFQMPEDTHMTDNEADAVGVALAHYLAIKEQ